MALQIAVCAQQYSSNATAAMHSNTAWLHLRTIWNSEQVAQLRTVNPKRRVLQRYSGTHTIIVVILNSIIMKWNIFIQFFVCAQGFGFCMVLPSSVAAKNAPYTVCVCARDDGTKTVRCWTKCTREICSMGCCSSTMFISLLLLVVDDVCGRHLAVAVRVHIIQLHASGEYHNTLIAIQTESAHGWYQNRTHGRTQKLIRNKLIYGTCEYGFSLCAPQTQSRIQWRAHCIEWDSYVQHTTLALF